MVLPIALLTIAAILITKGFTGKSLSEIINGEVTPEDWKDSLPGFDSDADAIESVKGDLQRMLDTPSVILPGSYIAKTQPITIDGIRVAGWIGAIVLWARKNGWSGRVTSGIRSDADQRRACQGVCGNPNGCPGRCAEPGTSNHKGTLFPAGAVDVSDPAGFARVLSKYPGGAPIKNELGAQDPVHFSRSGH